MNALACTRRVCALAAGLLLLPGCGNLLTGDAESGRTNYAVIVGISGYQSPSLSLKWGDEDALDFYDALRRGKNWEADKITLLTNSAATRDAIKRAIGSLAKMVGSDDQVVFYFSGRGSYGPDQPPFDEGDGLDEYLLPYDAAAGNTGRDLSDDELEALFASLPSNNVLVILDTCFGGSGGRPAALGKEKFLTRSGGGRGVPRGLDGMGHDLARPGYILFTAAQAGGAAVESNQLRNGVFTHFLVEGLQGAANPGQRAVTAQQAFEYASARTGAYSAGQSPQLIDNRGKNFRLAAF